MSKITWLHLSDLHYCESRSGWDAVRVLSTLAKDLTKMQQEYGLHPDLVFFTGDIVYGQIDGTFGDSISTQFSGAANFFEAIRKSFDPEIAVENVFLVPGNHDVNRAYVTEDQIQWLANQDDDAQINQLIKEKSLQWRRYIERLQDYRNFLQEHFPHLVQDPDRLTYTIIREIRNTTVRIIGLNTAWSSSQDGEKGKLWMGSHWQIENAVMSPGSSDLSISLMHHPSNWLVPSEDPYLARELERDTDFSLHGHEHQEWVAELKSHTRIAAGACYERSDKENGYNFVDIDLEKGAANVWLRRYHRGGAGWVPEVVPERTDNNGVWSVSGIRAQFPLLALNELKSVVPSVSFPFPNFLENEPSQEHPFRAYGSDLRPVIDAWVGREAELSAFESVESGVVVNTGIGGQGKSFLVARFLETWLKKNPAAFWDWRDCREEGEQFHTQLIALIEHFTDGRVKGEQLADADTRTAIRYFFELVGDRKGVIVLDNVDHYVSQRDEKFKLGVGVFVEEALRVAPNLLIMLTCRPRVFYASPRYLEIALKGIELTEAVELFKLRGVRINEGTRTQIHEIWTRTGGHPLWLNLIAIQMFRNPQTAPNIIEELRKGQVDDRTRSMFRALWNGLNQRQRTVLRSMAEIHYPETMESIHDFVGTLAGSRLQFIRAFKGLKALGLVVERGSGREGSKFDLHPLVRSFIRTEYPSSQDRLPYIQPILLFLARFIQGVSGPSENSRLEDLQRWSAKAELEMATNNQTTALETISRAGDQLIARGFHEEFFRVAKPILEEVNWSSIEMQDSRHFHGAVTHVISSLVEHKREDEGRAFLVRYGEAAGTTVARIRFLTQACYIEWILGNYDQAIAFGREGKSLKEHSYVDTTSVGDISYNLALALRDSGQWDEALKIFAPDQSIEEILTHDPNTSGKSSTFYGNVGRCLQFKGQLSEALQCYVKSASILRRSSSSIDILNRGYAALWIAEVLEGLNDLEAAHRFYRWAVHIWITRAPVRVSDALKGLNNLSSRVKKDVISISDLDAEKYCHRWIDTSLEKVR
jgi:tetratricopeptide (TPR) repeat protein/predicted MPP superfamily phosphohydrolase